MTHRAVAKAPDLSKSHDALGCYHRGSPIGPVARPALQALVTLYSPKLGLCLELMYWRHSSEWLAVVHNVGETHRFADPGHDAAQSTVARLSTTIELP
jgi:hypothetical protein